MLEKIRIALSPLEKGGDFWLKTVAYGIAPHRYVIELQSAEVSYFFSGKNIARYPATTCHIYVSRSKTWYSAAELFPAMDIEIRFGRPDPGEWARPELGYFPRGDPQNVTDLDVLDFYQDLERLSRAIRENKEEIQTVLLSDHADAKILDLILPKAPYAVRDTQPARREAVNRPVPSFKEICTTMIDALGFIGNGDTITLDVIEGKVDITTVVSISSDYIANSRLLFHSTDAGGIEPYLLFLPWIPFKTKYPEFMDNEWLVFSLLNVCEQLNIDYPPSQNEILSDLRQYCQLLVRNWDKIRATFSEKNIDIEQFYEWTKNFSGNNRDEVKRIWENLNDLCED